MTIQNPGKSVFGRNSARALSISPITASLKPFQNSAGLLSGAWRWIRSRQASRANSRRLQVAATVSLGEKRFLAVIQVDGLQFLIGGGATSVALLAQLHPEESFGELLNETITVPDKQQAMRSRRENIKPAVKQAKEQQLVKLTRKRSIKPVTKQAKVKA
jgi:flagellar biogenesis protein FliO